MAQVRVWFSEPVDPHSAQIAANYSLSGGVTISAAAVGSPPNDRIAILSTTPQPEGEILTLTLSNVKDMAGNAMASNSAKAFRTHVWLPGKVLHEFWENISGGILILRANSRFPLWPSLTTFEPRFEFPPDSASSFADNYGNKLSTWFVPPESADYVFFACSDDPSNLYLSTDADPANKKLIARETGWSSERHWTTTGQGSAATKRSDTFAQSEWPPARGAPIHLEAGKRYYLEALHTEGNGLDNVSATFMKVGESEPQNGDEPRLGGTTIGYYLDPNIELAFIRRPMDQQGIPPSISDALLAKDFSADDGGFTVRNTSPAPPGPWLHDPVLGRWVAEGSTPRANGCDGPYASRLNSPEYKLEQDGMVTLSFSHRYSFEPRWDGGQVWLKLNDGLYRRVAPNNFFANGFAPTPVSDQRELGQQRAFNGDSPGYHNEQFVTSQVLLGTFHAGDRLSIQFLGSWDACSTGTHPNWEIASFRLDLLPMATHDFAKSDGSYSVDSTTPAAPGSWAYMAAEGLWEARVSDAACQRPFASILTSPPYAVSRSDHVALSFTHSYSFQNDGRDAGQVRISVNGSPFTPLSAASFTTNGYAAGVIRGSGALQGQFGFSGDARSITSTASLGELNHNDKITLQFVGAWDACSGARSSSWQIHNLQLHFGRLPTAVTFEGQAVASLYGESRGVTYQWQRQNGADFEDITGATSAALRFFPSAVDFEGTFRLVANVPGKSIASEPVKLTTDQIAPPSLQIISNDGKVWIAFTGRLQEASNVNGPYSEVIGAASPFPVLGAASVSFFRSVR